MKNQTSAIIRIMTPVQIRSFRNGLRSLVTQTLSTGQLTRIDKVKLRHESCRQRLAQSLSLTNLRFFISYAWRIIDYFARRTVKCSL